MLAPTGALRNVFVDGGVLEDANSVVSSGKIPRDSDVKNPTVILKLGKLLRLFGRWKDNVLFFCNIVRTTQNYPQSIPEVYFADPSVCKAVDFFAAFSPDTVIEVTRSSLVTSIQSVTQSKADQLAFYLRHRAA